MNNHSAEDAEGPIPTLKPVLTMTKSRPAAGMAGSSIKPVLTMKKSRASVVADFSTDSVLKMIANLQYASSDNAQITDLSAIPCPCKQ